MKETINRLLLIYGIALCTPISSCSSSDHHSASYDANNKSDTPCSAIQALRTQKTADIPLTTLLTVFANNYGDLANKEAFEKQLESLYALSKTLPTHKGALTLLGEKPTWLGEKISIEFFCLDAACKCDDPEYREVYTQFASIELPKLQKERHRTLATFAQGPQTAARFVELLMQEQFVIPED